MGHSAPRYAVRDAIDQAVAATLGDRLVETHAVRGEYCFLVRREALAEALQLLRDQHDYQQLMEIAGVDYPDRAERFEIVYCLLSLTANHRIRVACRTDEYAPVPTVTHLWPVAGWLEREVYDLYGVLFEGNPDLRRILTDYGFKGHPFRKDFPLTGYHELRYSEEQGRVVYEPVQLAQDFRTFDFMSPWEGADYVLPGDEKVPGGPPVVDKPKVTEKKGESGAGEPSDSAAEKRRSKGSPAQNEGGKAPPEPKQTRTGHNGTKAAAGRMPKPKAAPKSRRGGA